MGKKNLDSGGKAGRKNGFVITMLATSLSDRIESLDDVGKKGDLGDFYLLLNRIEIIRVD